MRLCFSNGKSCLKCYEFTWNIREALKWGAKQQLEENKTLPKCYITSYSKLCYYNYRAMIIGFSFLIWNCFNKHSVLLKYSLSCSSSHTVWLKAKMLHSFAGDSALWMSHNWTIFSWNVIASDKKISVPEPEG